MRLMMLLRATPLTESGAPPDEKTLTGMAMLMEDMAKAGILLGGDGLKPSSEGKRIRFENGKVTHVVDGPFAETKELIAGFAIIRVDSWDAAMPWIERFAEVEGSGESEIRPMFDADDFGDEFTPEARAAEDRSRELAAQN